MDYKNMMMKPKGAHTGSTEGQSKERKLQHYKMLLSAGEITQAEYNRKVAALG